MSALPPVAVCNGQLNNHVKKMYSTNEMIVVPAKPPILPPSAHLKARNSQSSSLEPLPQAIP